MKKKYVSYVDSQKKRLNSLRRKDRFKRHFKAKSIKYIPIVVLCACSLNLFTILFSVAWWFLATCLFDYEDIFDFTPTINVWFGLAGTGKTTMAAYISKRFLKCKYNVLSNVPIEHTLKLDNNDLGTVDMSFGGDGAEVIIDEAVDGFDSRNYSEFARTNKPKYFATQRHQNNRVDLFSQAYDIDKRIRDRGRHLYYLKPTFLRGFVCVKKISKVLTINKEDKQFIDGFEFYGLPRFIYSKSVWGSFDTLDLSLVPKIQKEWKEYYTEDIFSDSDKGGVSA